MIKDKQGKEYTYKEFIAKWKQGIEGITPLQQIKSQIKGNTMIALGLVCGIVVLGFNIKNSWWIEIILAAALFNTAITLIGLKQRKKGLEQVYNINMEELKHG